MTLALIAIAAAVLARVGAKGLERTLESRSRLERLQSDWVTTSTRLALLNNAGRLFEDSEALWEQFGAGWPYPGEFFGQFEIGGVSYRFQLLDEQARTNLNTAHGTDPTSIGALFTEWRRSFEKAPPLKHDAAHPLQAAGDASRPYRSWGQLIDYSRLRQTARASSLEGVLIFARAFSLSENQRLNVRRASDEALRNTARLVLTPSEAESLVDVRVGHSGDLRGWLASADIPSRRLVKLRRLLTDRSSDYSLWLWNVTENKLVMTTTGAASGITLQWP